MDTPGSFLLSRNLTNNGLLDLNGDGDIGGGSQLLNDGTLRKSAGTGVSLVSPGSLTAVGPRLRRPHRHRPDRRRVHARRRRTFTVADGALLTFEPPGV